MTVLVTGGSGLIGIHVAKALSDTGERVVCVDIKSKPPYADHILEQAVDAITFVEGDVLDIDWLTTLAAKCEVQGIVHAAAVVNENVFRADPARGFKVNLLGTLNVLEIARRNHVRRVVFTSSATVYGPRDSISSIAEEPPAPQSLYAESKHMGERMLERYREVYGVRALVVRVSTAYGPGKPWNPERYPLQRMLWEAMRGAHYYMAEGADYLRDFTYISDTALGVCLAYQSASPKYGVYNIAAGTSFSLSEVAQTLNELFPHAHIEVGPGRFDGDFALSGSLRGPLDISRARGDLDFVPQFDLSRGLQEYGKFLMRFPPK